MVLEQLHRQSPGNLSEMQNLNPGTSSLNQITKSCYTGLDHTSELSPEHTREPECLHTLHLCRWLRAAPKGGCKFPGTSSFHVVDADSNRQRTAYGQRLAIGTESTPGQEPQAGK